MTRGDNDHEHKWLRGSIGRVASDDEGVLCIETFRCSECEQSVWLHHGIAASYCPTAYGPDAFLHTCHTCNHRYRDGDPFSQFCTPECRDQSIEHVRLMETKRQIVMYEYIATGKRNANEADRVDARRKLRGFAENEQDETVRGLAKEALKRASGLRP